MPIPKRGRVERILSESGSENEFSSIKIRRFIVMFLLTLPFALVHRVEDFWLVPLITMLVGYPLLSLDQIGIELENPFSRSNLSHLPLDDIEATIERNVLGVLKAKQTDSLQNGLGARVAIRIPLYLCQRSG